MTQPKSPAATEGYSKHFSASQRIVHLFGWTLLAVIALTGCAGQPERLWLNAPGWSRAQLLGRTGAADPVPITLDDAGHLYLFLIRAGDNAAHPRVLSLSRSAAIVWDRTYESVDLISAQKPRIVWSSDALQLFWISQRRLYAVGVTATGDLRGSPTLLSGDAAVADYDVAIGPEDVLAVWYAGPRREPGLYALPPGAPPDGAILVDVEGVRPDLQYDDAGTLHVVWAHYPPGSGDKPFFYAAYPNGVYVPGRETVVATPRASGATVLEGPRLGLDKQGVYIFWSMTFYSGLQAGAVQADYVYFPMGRPAAVSPARQLRVPYSYDLPYQRSVNGWLEAGPRVPLEPDFRGGSPFVTEMAANPVTEEELAVACHVRVAYLMRKETPQIGMLFFQNGAPTGYQLLSFTPANSTDPALLSDDLGRLYITWLERGEPPGFSAYFASTAPDLRQALDNVTSDDLGRVAADTLFGLLAGALLLPFAVVWSVVPLLVIGISALLRTDDESWTSPGTIVSVVLAFGVYWVGKLAFLPDILEYVPFSAWLPVVPAWLRLPLRVGVPLLSAGLAIAIAWYFTFKRDSRSPFTYMLTYCIVDSVLTMAVYGVLVYAAF